MKRSNSADVLSQNVGHPSARAGNATSMQAHESLPTACLLTLTCVLTLACTPENAPPAASGAYQRAIDIGFTK